MNKIFGFLLILISPFAVCADISCVFNKMTITENNNGESGIGEDVDLKLVITESISVADQSILKIDGDVQKVVWTIKKETSSKHLTVFKSNADNLLNLIHKPNQQSLKLGLYKSVYATGTPSNMKNFLGVCEVKSLNEK